MVLRVMMVMILWFSTANAQGAGVQLTYLGNMGMVLDGGGTVLVIDGLHHGELAEYAAIPDTLLSSLENGRAPYQRVTVALTTHRHKDHFNPLSVASRLSADTAMIFAAPAETVDSLLGQAREWATSSRVRRVSPSAAGRTQVVAGVTALGLPHNPTPTRLASNVGYLVEVGGLRILHVGDADPNVAIYRELHLDEEHIDVAVVPFWYLLGGSDSLRRLIRPRLWVAAHVPPREAVEVQREVLRRYRNAIVLGQPGEQRWLR